MPCYGVLLVVHDGRQFCTKREAVRQGTGLVIVSAFTMFTYPPTRRIDELHGTLPNGCDETVRSGVDRTGGRIPCVVEDGRWLSK